MAYGTSPDEVIKIVLDAVESFDGCSSLIKSGKRSSKVVMTNMGESSIALSFLYGLRVRVYLPLRVSHQSFSY